MKFKLAQNAKKKLSSPLKTELSTTATMTKRTLSRATPLLLLWVTLTTAKPLFLTR